MDYFYEKHFLNTKKKTKNKKKQNFPLLISKYDFVSFFPCAVSVFIITFTERNYFYDNHYINTK